MNEPTHPIDDKEYTLVEHLRELRERVVRGGLGLILVTCCLIPLGQELMAFFRVPLDVGLSKVIETALKMEFPDETLVEAAKHVRFVGIKAQEVFLSKLKLSLVAGVFVASPWLTYQLWLFIAPGLYQHERRWAMSFVWAGAFFFILGGAFAYYAVFPNIFYFFIEDTLKSGIDYTLSIGEYLGLVMKLLLAFGVAFQAPVIVFVLCIAGIVEPKTLANARPYIIVGGFVLGAALTPPDVVSQTMLAVPMALLFELGLLAGRIAIRLGGKSLSKEARAEARAEADKDAT